MSKDKAIEEAMASIENRVRHVYNQGFEDGYAKGKEQTDGRIKVGDEVYHLDRDNRRIVTAVLKGSIGDVAVQMAPSGKWCANDVCDLHKTGRHFPQIEEVLKLMKGEEDETN